MKISVLLPVYNSKRWLTKAVQSVCIQTIRDFELIAIDDGSTDASLSLLRNLQKLDGRIIIISRRNTGIVGALNDGLAIAKGEFIARMDGDDIAHPNRFERQLQFMETHPECVALGSATVLIDSMGGTIGEYRPPECHDAIVAQLLTGNGAALVHPSVLFRKSALLDISGYDPAWCKAEDLDLFFRIAEKGQLANLNEDLLKYRLHRNSTNFAHRSKQRKLINGILDRERAKRNLPAFNPSDNPAPADAHPADLHLEWACNGARLGSMLTAVRHLIYAIALKPSNPKALKTLGYILHTTRRNGP